MNATTLTDRRIGIFRIQLPLINSDPEAVRAVMADVIVVKADFQLAHDRVEYTALCDDFAEVRPAATIPYYTAQLHRATHGRVMLVGWDQGSI